ncbi:MAG: glycosyltransferase family 2 protein [Candidatus Brocadiae bacterium]|nr:glycosyltransferase family 2 protein [Candidatus Brocadiia bacterium]
MPLSTLILTLNEEQDLRGCLQSVGWCGDVVVLDSLSSDGTQAIAESLGARFFQREFDDFAGQRNYAIDNIEFKHDWVFHLDADERFTPALLDECVSAISKDAHSGFLVPSKMVLWGRWLKHAAAYPVYQMRLTKLGEIRFAQYGHGQREFAAKRGIGRLSEPYLHHSFSGGVTKWLERHSRYAVQEAAQSLAELRGRALNWRCLFSKNVVSKRRALKELSFRLPFRPWLKFFYMYVLRMGFLDGAPGLTYCALQAIYEYMICLKIKELRRREKGLPV